MLSCDFCGMDDGKLVFEFEHGYYDTYDDLANKPTLNYYVDYFVSHNNGKMVNSLLSGNLVSKATLKPNTSYVVQVINDTKTDVANNIEINVNGENKILNFNQYLYFNTTGLINTETECRFIIAGASYGYQILHTDIDGIV